MDGLEGNDLVIVLFIGMMGMFVLALSIVLFVFVYRKRLMEQELVYRQNLVQKAIDIQEEERKRFAADLHDEIGGGISTILLTVSHLTDLVDKESSAVEQIGEIRKQLTVLLEGVREISHNITPEVLESYGLIAALSDLFYQIQLSGKLMIDFQVDENYQRLSFSHELAVYRICKELTTNTIKHAEATHITVRISRQSDIFELIYEDNGKGFNMDEMIYRGGMKNMKNRAAFLGAIFELSSEQNTGVKARLFLKTHK